MNDDDTNKIGPPDNEETIYITPSGASENVIPPITPTRINKGKKISKKKKEKKIVFKKPKIPNFDGWKKTEIQSKKMEMLIKLERLKKQFPLFKIPDLSSEDNIEDIYVYVHHFDRHIAIESKVEKYKIFLYASFVIIEYVTTNVLKICTTGFTTNQIHTLKRYDYLLYEIAAKNISTKSSYSPELKLLISLGVNSLIFIIVKAIFNNVGNDYIKTIQNSVLQLFGEDPGEDSINIVSLINSFFGGGKSHDTTSTTFYNE